MAVRMICSKFLPGFRTSRKLVLPEKHFAAVLSSYHHRRSWIIPAVPICRQLHVRIYDKDARYEEQRKANHIRFQNPVSEDFNGDNLLRSQEVNVKPQRQSRNAGKPIYRQQGDKLAANADDADNFGTSSLADNDFKDEGDQKEEELLNNPIPSRQKLKPIHYAHMIKDHLKAKRVKEAINILEDRMLKQDRVKPDTYTYNLLISGCAKAGYTRKAFGLYNRMRKRGLRVTGGTYTSLFNACANAPSTGDGLGRANHLREIMLEKGYEPNIKNYNAMIKAYGRCGDVKTAYLLADEILDRKLAMTAETFNFLLQACASDAEFGFRHCLLTWHKMLKHGFRPDYYTFSTVLRCVRDTNIGDIETMQQVLQQIISDGKKIVLQNPSENTKAIAIANTQTPAPTDNVKSADQNNPFKNTAALQESIDTNVPSLRFESTAHSLQLQTNSEQLSIPNLLKLQPHLGSLVELTEVHQAHERFLLLGGLTGFLELMKQNNITPDIQMFTALLEVIPPTIAAEKQLLSFVRKIGLKSDIDFFNVLIKKRSMRFDYEAAKEVLTMVRTTGLQPDIVTYGVLALGCQTEEAAHELLHEMRNNGVRMNIEILGAMLRQGCHHRSFSYVMSIMQIALDEHIKPNEMFLRHLYNFHRGCARAIDARHPSTKTTSYKKQHGKFCDKLRLYYEELEISNLKLEDAIKKITERPYDQYKEPIEDGLEPVKNEKIMGKNKMRKYIKKIKLENLQDDPSPKPTLEHGSKPLQLD